MDKPEKVIKPYMSKIYSRSNYARISEKPSADNWILVGDAYCFPDPVYSVGTAVSMLEAVTIAKYLNENNGVFNHEWYQNNCQALFKIIVEGMDAWYSNAEAIFDEGMNEEINTMILKGAFAKNFTVSNATKKAHQIQSDYGKTFGRGEGNFNCCQYPIKIYYFDKKAFDVSDSKLTLIFNRQRVYINNKKVEHLIKKFLLGNKLSYPDIYLISEQQLRNIKDHDYFWKLIKVIEHFAAHKESDPKPLYYFHFEWYERQNGQLRLGDDERNFVINDSAIIDFYEELRGKFYLKEDLDEMFDKHTKANPTTDVLDLKKFYAFFGKADQFGKSYCLSGQYV